MDATGAARTILIAEKKESEPVTALNFVRRLGNALPESNLQISAIPVLLEQYNIDPNTPITRGEACILIFHITTKN